MLILREPETRVPLPQPDALVHRLRGHQQGCASTLLPGRRPNHGACSPPSPRPGCRLPRSGRYGELGGACPICASPSSVTQVGLTPQVRAWCRRAACNAETTWPRVSSAARTSDGARPSDSSASLAVRSPKDSKRGREVLPQHGSKPQHLTGPLPDRGLMCSGQQLNRVGQIGVSGDLPVIPAIHVDDLGEHVSIAGVALWHPRSSDALGTAPPTSG